ncbi:MAG: thiamine phosphate synthase [Rhodothermales bacterium]|nr:thiamine phosphate synthase [Rhodothermales bacterium]
MLFIPKIDKLRVNMLLHVEIPEPKLKVWTAEALQHLPKLALIADGFSDREVAYNTVKAVQSGVEWVHLRDHSISEKRFWEIGRILVGRLRRVNEEVLISVNRYAQFAGEWYTGVHVGAAGVSIEDARNVEGVNGPIGYSAHNFDVAHAAFDAGAHYVFFSPIFPTASKPDHPGEGIDELAKVCDILSPNRVYALGGVTPERVRRCLDAGAAGVAVASGITRSDDPIAAAAAYLEELTTG